MKLRLSFLLLIFLGYEKANASKPDSVYLFAYSTTKNSHRNGLHFAWSQDKTNWVAIGPEHSFVKCDYGRWGSEKKMFNPTLFKGAGNLWHLVWSLNDTDGAIGHVTSKDLIYWGRQSYPILNTTGPCLQPEAQYANGEYTINWTDKKGKAFTVRTKDWENFEAAPQRVAQPKSNYTIRGSQEEGTLLKVPYTLVENMINHQTFTLAKKAQEAERIALQKNLIKDPVSLKITLDPSKQKKISEHFLGIFFEDINYAADGGIYAELIQNRGFEYHPDDREGRDKSWNSYKAWKVNSTSDATFKIDSTTPIHKNNSKYAVLDIKKRGGALINEGFGGIPVTAGEKYDFSVFARSAGSKSSNLVIQLLGANGEVLGTTTLQKIGTTWKKYSAVITANQSFAQAQLAIVPQQVGKVNLDMISLFPQKTFKNRKNGLRADLAQVVADLKPRFVRFPGGCVAHGDGIANMYRWENTIGALETRKPQRNMWGYHQTAGLGYFEYFLFCEDIAAEPIPIVAAGVPCQNSAHHGCAIGGQQGGIPLDQMDEYINSVLNLIEYANGGVNTFWGKKRAEAGHHEPFNLKYIGVGNEDLITDVFEERFKLINNAIKKKYPEITVIGTVGPFNEGTDYVEGWEIADEMKLDMVDEHYYQSPGWYLNNQNFYDSYDKNKSKVYLGEYAAHIPGRHNNLETALSEALHLINLERNADIVTMTSYAPLLAKEGFTQWNPDLIYFNNTEVKPTVGYYVQQLFGHNSGKYYIPHNLSSTGNAYPNRLAASVVKNENELIIKQINLLPVEVKSSVGIPYAEYQNKTATLTTLSGDLEDKTVKPIISEIKTGKELELTLPPYSFSVVKIKTK